MQSRNTDYETLFLGFGGALLFALYGILFIYLLGGFGPVSIASAEMSLEIHNSYFETNPTYPELEEYFQALAENEGGERAFEVLIYGDLPPNTDTHLLGHAVGDIYYLQAGIDGMRICDGNLGYSCAHSVVINALLVDGEGVFNTINDICNSIGIPGSYEMCFHGFGHAVLAYTEFNLPEAIALCGRVGTPEFNYNDEKECAGGVIMEMRGGIHNPILWEEKGKPFLDPENPLAMCQADYMPDKYKEICYIYITPFIFDVVTENNFPTPDDYNASMQYCDVVTNQRDREACYGGFW